jgi:hypothetical protein
MRWSYWPTSFRPRGASPAARIEAAAAWTLFRFNWALLAAVIAVFDLALLFTDFRLRPVGYLVAIAVAALYGVCGYRSATSPTGQPWVASLLTGIAQIILVLAVMTSLTYIAAAANFPMQDATFLALDRAMGFDFRAYVAFVNDRHLLLGILAFAYRAISWPIVVVVIVLPLAGRYLRTSKYVLALLLALIATTCISMIVPAIGAYGAIGLVPSDYPNFEPQAYYDTLINAPLIRSGALRELDLIQLKGVIAFPSFHAAAAVIYMWALWPVPVLRWANLLLNIAMLFATPIGGGHFLIDVIAGIAVAVSCIAAANRIAARLLSDQARSAERESRSVAAFGDSFAMDSGVPHG